LRSTGLKKVTSSDADERLSALVQNAAAVQAIASAVEGTLGPKGLNCMLVDRFGDVTITNDGSTILEKIEVHHPAAKLVIGTAKAQDEEIGDGTTTATILAAALVNEGLGHAGKGVPVTKIVEGIRLGVRVALDCFRAQSRPLDGLDDPLLRQAAVIAGRGEEDVADLAVQAARLVPPAKLRDRAFKLSECVVAEPGAENEVFAGIVVDRERLNRQMPRQVCDAKVLVLDDALEPEEIEEEALGTEPGFRRYMELQEQFRRNVQKIVDLGVKLVIVAKGIDSAAEEILTDGGLMVLRRVPRGDIARIVTHTGARTIKRAGLNRSADELQAALGQAERAFEDERLGHVRIVGGRGEPTATLLVGAATAEVRAERQRIAEDAAAATQAAINDGVLPGGGAAEIAAARETEKARTTAPGMTAYGVDCVVEALKKPLAQMAANAGLNPLEKVGDVLAAQAERRNGSLGVDFDDGRIADMIDAGVVDPTAVKVYALRAAAEIAEATLRINAIIRKREESEASAGPIETATGAHGGPAEPRL
jgi:chaperonin GroEL (HSP60 family)